MWKIIHHIGLLQILGMMIGEIKDFLKLKEDSDFIMIELDKTILDELYENFQIQISVLNGKNSMLITIQLAICK